MAKRYVAYSNLANHKSGQEVDPEDFGGVDSEDFRYMVEHRTIVPMGDPDAPAPPEDTEEPVAAPTPATSPADATVRQPGQPAAQADSSTGNVKPSSGSSPAGSSSAAAAKPTGSTAS